MQIRLGNSITVFALFALVLSPPPAGAHVDDLESAVRAVLQVDKEGKGHDAAVEAMKTLNAAKASDIPTILRLMDDASPLARNWLRAAIDGAIQRDPALPIADIREFFDDHSHSNMGRALAFEILRKNDPEAAAAMIPGLIDDPSLPLRRLAIDYYVEQATGKPEPEAIGALGYALSYARETDQVTKLKDELAKRNIQIDLRRQMGFLTEWQLVGPFDNSKEAGFNVAHGPETNLQSVDTKAEYDGKPEESGPRKVKWIAHETSDPSGVVNVNEQIGKVKGAIAYALTEFKSEAEQPVQIRVGCINAVKVWVNGEEVINEEVYHVGFDPDQYVGTATLKAGANQILLKVCQNEQEEQWAQDWMYQVRVCDATGKTVLPAAEPAPQQ